MVAWFIRRSGSWVLEACPGENSLPLPFCAYQYCFLMLTLFILYLPFFPHMRLLWTLVWKWSIFFMVVAHLWLWVHFHPLLCSMSGVWLHPWASLPSGFWLGCSSGSTDRGLGVRGWFIPAAASLPGHCGWAVSSTGCISRLEVLFLCSPEFLACANSPSGTSSLAFQGTR